jgi:hypothetical protein
MAHSKKRYIPSNAYDSSQTNDLDIQNNNPEYEHHGSAQFGDNEYELNEDNIDARRHANMDVGARVQGKGGRVEFGKMRKELVEQQRTVEVNARTGPKEVWDKLKKGEDATISDIWDPIDETTAPLPRSKLPMKFEKYPKHPEAEIDPEQMDNPAYLRTQIETIPRLLKRCRSKLEEVEQEAIQQEWDAQQVRKKARRY